MMETKNCLKIATLNQYQLSFDQDTPLGFNLYVCNTGTLERYCGKKVQFKNINYKGFQAALTGKNKDLSVQFKQTETEKQGEKQKFLQITINFRSTFLLSVTETISIPFVGKTSQLEFNMLKIEKINHRIKQIKDKYPKSAKRCKVIEQGDYKSKIDPNYGEDYNGENQADYDIKPFQSIDLPEHARYYIEISMFLKCKMSYWYFYHNTNYQTVFPSGGMTAPTNSYFIPLKFGYIVDNKTDPREKHTFFMYDIVDYPFSVQNMVVTATKLPE